MSPLLFTGIVTIFLAFFAYTAGAVAILRGRRITLRTASILTLGLALDAIATACMFALTSEPLTFHGWVGIVALAIMAVLVLLVWRHLRAQGDGPSPRRGAEGTTPAWLYRYTWVAYLLWLVAFVMGVVLGASR